MISVELSVGDVVDDEYEECDCFVFELDDAENYSKVWHYLYNYSMSCGQAKLFISFCGERKFEICSYQKIQTKTKSGKNTRWIVDYD